MGTFIDLTQKKYKNKFGKWRVLHRDDTRPEPMAFWVCRCKTCGTTLSVDGKNLRSGKSTKCRRCADKDQGGKPSYKRGEMVGNWTILRRDKNATGYLCRCECGFEAIRQIGNLGGGKTRGCKSCWRKRLAGKGRKPRRKLTDRTVSVSTSFTLVRYFGQFRPMLWSFGITMAMVRVVGPTLPRSSAVPVPFSITRITFQHFAGTVTFPLPIVSRIPIDPSPPTPCTPATM